MPGFWFSEKLFPTVYIQLVAYLKAMKIIYHSYRMVCIYRHCTVYSIPTLLQLIFIFGIIKSDKCYMLYLFEQFVHLLVMYRI